MTIKVRIYRKGGWEVDIHTRRPDGTPVRERVLAPVTGKTAAREWALKRERVLALGLDQVAPKAPIFREFAKRYIEHLEAARHKESGISTRRRAIKLHILPVIGQLRLNELAEEHVDQITRQMANQQPRSINGVLSTLLAMLRRARRRKLIATLPCEIALVRVPKREKPFYDYGDFAKLVECSKLVDWKTHLIVLLGGRAGLRRGEMIALRWVDVNMDRRTITVRQQCSNGHFSPPKGGKERVIPMAAELARALRTHRHLQGEFVLAWGDGHHLNETSMRRLMGSACRLANLPEGIHILRHTFCSHLSMRGVPVRTIQELAGHASLETTTAYMHLSPSAAHGGIVALDRGDMAETRKRAKRNTQGDNA